MQHNCLFSSKSLDMDMFEMILTETYLKITLLMPETSITGMDK